jgi:predicted transcriptional regulator
MQDASNPTIEVDATLKGALENVVELITNGHGSVTPEEAARLREALDQVKQQTEPRDEIAKVVFTQEGGLFLVHDERSWQDFRSLTPEEPQARPGKAMQVGNSVILLTPEGQSILMVLRNAEKAGEILDVMIEEYEAWKAENQPREIRIEQAPQA